MEFTFQRVYLYCSCWNDFSLLCNSYYGVIAIAVARSTLAVVDVVLVLLMFPSSTVSSSQLKCLSRATVGGLQTFSGKWTTPLKMLMMVTVIIREEKKADAPRTIAITHNGSK